MTKYLVEESTLSGIADAIREQTGDSAPIMLSNFASQIQSIQGGGSAEYSTTEHEVGTWIDGSKIYSKTIHVQPTGNTSDYVTAESLTDADIIISTEFVAKRYNQQIDTTYYYTGNGSTYPEALEYSSYKLGARVSAGNIQYYVAGYGAQITDMWITLLYTKVAVNAQQRNIEEPEEPEEENEESQEEKR